MIIPRLFDSEDSSLLVIVDLMMMHAGVPNTGISKTY
jgi:hypothetical protein